MGNSNSESARCAFRYCTVAQSTAPRKGMSSESFLPLYLPSATRSVDPRIRIVHPRPRSRSRLSIPRLGRRRRRARRTPRTPERRRRRHRPAGSAGVGGLVGTDRRRRRRKHFNRGAVQSDAATENHVAKGRNAACQRRETIVQGERALLNCEDRGISSTVSLSASVRTDNHGRTEINLNLPLRLLTTRRNYLSRTAREETPEITS